MKDGYSDVYLLVDIHVRSRCRAYFTDYTAFGLDMSSVYGVLRTTRVCDASTANQLDKPEDHGLPDTRLEVLLD